MFLFFFCMNHGFEQLSELSLTCLFLVMKNVSLNLDAPSVND